MNYWLIKSEPHAFSIDMLKKMPHQTTAWDGVRNYQARNYLKSMKKNDEAFFYHSSCKKPGIAGIVKIIHKAYPEPNQSDGAQRWFCVDVQLIQKFSEILSLKGLRENPALNQMIILRKGNRLSVTPVANQEAVIILSLI